MTILILSLSFLVLAITLANVLIWPRIRISDCAEKGVVSVLIPARNEEEHLPGCLDAVISQGSVVGEILVYDDNSTDRTTEVIASASNRDPRVKLLVGRPLEPGWTGKNFACDNLARAASSRYLLFLDADARLQPDAIKSLYQEIVSRQLVLLSCWPGLVTVSFWERLLMPMLNFVVFSIYPSPLSLFLGYPSLALAHGACLLFEREGYFIIGGHRAVRDQIFEDTRLAQLCRQRGQRGLCLDGQDLVRVRMYGNFSGIWQGFLKNFYPAFRRESSFWVFTLFHLLVNLVPFIALPLYPVPALIIAAASILASRVLLVIRFRQSFISVLLHPLAEALLLLLGLTSRWRYRTGRGVTWKGRSYHDSGITPG
ncbi:MAG: glycosyltransferase [Acidobacteria bacterium]|nr:glycosyltransferase [Acidobacteriota bacterium]